MISEERTDCKPEGREVVIFGTGEGGRMAKWQLEDFGCRVIAFSDNNQAKWGTAIEDVPVISPAELLNRNAAIVIASTWEQEIAQQLTDMGMGERIVGKEEFEERYVREHAEEYTDIFEWRPDENKPLTIVFGLDYGLYKGGVESWAYTVADEFVKRGYRIKFLTCENSDPAPERFAKDTYYLNMRGKGYCKGLKDTIDAIMENAPCVMIDSWQSMSMVAAAIVKKQNPQALCRLIEIVHNDLPRLFRRIQVFEEWIDVCMGVSRDINTYLNREYHVPEEKIGYKESPVNYGSMERTWTINPDEPVRIGYAARLVKSQKRADLLIPLIQKLIEKNVNFSMEIAGDGDLAEKLQNFVEEQQLEQRVRLTGFVPREQMNAFWLKQDIFVNLSEYEGVCLSLLESIGNGCVPVMTKTAGSTEFVLDDNGFICEVGALDAIADRIAYLAAHRDEMQTRGKCGMERTRARCSSKAYVDYILKRSGMQ